MQFNLNLIVGLDDLPDKLAELISGKEQNLSRQFEEIQHQLDSRKINSPAILKNISELRQCLVSLDQELQTYAQAISFYEAATMKREAVFLQQQMEDFQKEQEQQGEHDDQ